MHQRSISELQGASTQQGASTRRTTQDEASRSSRWRRGAVLCSCPVRAAPLWAWWLVLSALVLPGAWSFLSEEQEELLVELHNHYRGQVSPSASAMMPLRWDPSLKVIAEGYAAKCVWNHNPELEETGENLFAGTGPLDLREALEKWFLEHLDYSFHNNSCDDDKMCGHYTQMVWADTHRVGCAFHLCNNMEGLEWERVSYLVCNYYPAGNYEDQRPYVEGDWCSRCPENLQKCENNMCVADSEEEEEEEEEEDVEDGTDWVTLVPLPATSDPALPHEEQGNKEEEEMVVPPPATTEDQPVSTSTTTSTPLSDPEDPDTPSPETPSPDTPSPDTPSPDTPPPHVYSTTLGEEEEVVEMSEDKEVKEDKVVEMSEDKEVKEDKVDEMSEDKEVKEEKEEEEEEERKEPLDKTDKEREIDESRKRHLIPDRRNSGSVSSPSLLMASLTGILSLRL